MTTAYTPILQLALPVTGELNGTWGDVVNDNITSMIEEAIAGMATISTWAGVPPTHTLTTADGTTDEARCAILQFTGSPGAAAEVICPARTKFYVVDNQTTGGYGVTLKTASGAGITVPNGKSTLLYCDGTDVLSGANYVTSAGTATTADRWTTARNLAGNSVDGSANVQFANKFIVQGTADSGLSGAQFLGALGTGLVKNTTTSGILTIAVSGTDYAPATSGTSLLKGNGSGGFSNATSGTDYAPATSGTSILYGNGSGGFSNVTIGTGITFAGGTLSATGSGVTSVTGTSPVVSSGGTTPDISLASGYGDTQNPYASKTANYLLAAPSGSSGVPTFRAMTIADLPTVTVAKGGTGLTSTPTNGQLLIGNGTGYTLATITAGTNITITNSSGGITIDAAGGSAATPTSLGTVYGKTPAPGGFADSAYYGFLAGNSVTSGTNNTYVGAEAGKASTTASNNTAVGQKALYINNAGANTAVGTACLFFNSSGTGNTGIGYNAGISNSSGGSNVFVGANAGYSNTTASYNTFVGLSAGYATTGGTNTLIGTNAGYSGTNNLTTGTGNIIVGYNAAASSATATNEATWGSSSITSNRFWGDLKPGGTDAGTSGYVLTSQGAGTTPIWAAAAGGLTNWTDGINTSAPNATIPVATLTATNAATHVDAAIIPKGTDGSLLAQIPDGTSTGGDKRGVGSVDFQRRRTASTKVASGQLSAILNGYNATAAGNYSAVVNGNGCAALGSNDTIANGQNNTTGSGGGWSFIGSGYGSSSTNSYCFIGAGTFNSATGSSASVVSGGSNTASGGYSFVGAGQNNTASANWSVVAGGNNNTATASYSSVTGGYNNNATGTYSCVAGGSFNNASNGGSIFGGASHTASGNTSAVVGGRGNVADGLYSVLIGGSYGTARGVECRVVFPASDKPTGGFNGATQASLLNVGAETANNTPVVILTSAGTASATNQLYLDTSSAYSVRGIAVAYCDTTGDAKEWSFNCLIKRDSGGTTSIVGSPSVTSTYADAGASAWALAISADNTNKALAVTVTGDATNTMRISCRLDTIEVKF